MTALAVKLEGVDWRAVELHKIITPKPCAMQKSHPVVSAIAEEMRKRTVVDLFWLKCDSINSSSPSGVIAKLGSTTITVSEHDFCRSRVLARAVAVNAVIATELSRFLPEYAWRFHAINNHNPQTFIWKRTVDGAEHVCIVDSNAAVLVRNYDTKRTFAENLMELINDETKVDKVEPYIAAVSAILDKYLSYAATEAQCVTAILEFLGSRIMRNYLQAATEIPHILVALTSRQTTKTDAVSSILQLCEE